MSQAIVIKPHATWLNWARRNWAWLLVGLTILFVIAVRVRLRDMPLERDEGEYAYAGQLLLQGVPPYKDAYNMKLPGTYVAYAVIMALFGQTPTGIHLGVAVVNAISVILVFLLGRKLLDEVAGVTAAVCFGLMSLSPSVLGLAGHATHFVTLFALAGVLALMKGLEGERTSNVQLPTSNVEQRNGGKVAKGALLLSGLMFGLAFLMKQHGIFFAIFGVLFVLSARIQELRQSRAEIRNPWMRKRPVVAAGEASPRKSTFRAQMGGLPGTVQGAASPSSTDVALKARDGYAGRNAGETADRNVCATQAVDGSDGVAKPFRPAARAIPETPKREAPPGFPWKRTSYELALLCAGIALPYLLTCLWLLWAGVFHQFIFWTISYARQYVSEVEGSTREQMLRFNMSFVLGPNLGLWLLAISGAVMMWWEERLDAGKKVLLTTLLLCSLASVSVGFYFRPHYFITLLPVLALLCGLVVSRSMHLLRREVSLEVLLALALLLLTVAGVGGLVIGNSWQWFSATPDEVAQWEYQTSLFSDTRKAANYIREHGSKNARIAVFGSEPEIYFYSHRRSVTGYIYAYPLLEKQPYALQMQREMEAQIERGAPEYLVSVEHRSSLYGIRNSEPEMFKWWMRYWDTNLDLVATTTVMNGDGFLAGQDNADEHVTAGGSVLILKRKQ